ncbi:MAG: ABC transporter substrate-binding protein [Chloroflexota bacterium]
MSNEVTQPAVLHSFVSRRRLLSLLAAGGAGLMAAACATPAAPAPTKAPDATKAAATAAATAAAVPTQAPTQAGAAKPLAGITLNGAMFEHTFSAIIKEYLPEFEQKTGAKVNLELNAFAVYNQRADLELSTKGSAYDFMNITLIYSGRWIGAGWFTNLEDYIKDANKTPKEWDPDEFVMINTQKDKTGARFGFPWLGEVQAMAVARPDLIEKAGLKIPTTYDEMMKVMAAVDGKEGCKGFVTNKTHHWMWSHFLMGFGGNMFKAPPDDLTPTLDSKEAIEAADWYGRLLRDYSPDGVLTYTDDQMVTAQAQGRANISMHTLSWTIPLVDPKKSTVSDKVKYAMLPAGPKGLFPGIGSHGLGIPAGAKQKAAAWEFIKWALSKETIWRMVREKNYTSACRKSVINNPDFKKLMTFNGVDLAALSQQAFDMADKTPYMAYRTVPVFPQIGDKVNKAIEVITTKQMSAADAMKAAQAETVADFKKSGIKMDL